MFSVSYHPNEWFDAGVDLFGNYTRLSDLAVQLRASNLPPRATAIPTDAVISKSLPPTVIGAETVSRIRCAMSSAAPTLQSSRMTTNSSPPSRATVSPSRSTCDRRTPIWRAPSPGEPSGAWWRWPMWKR